MTEAEAVEGVDEAQPLTRAAQLALLSPASAAFHLAWPGIIEQLIRDAPLPARPAVGE